MLNEEYKKLGLINNNKTEYLTVGGNTPNQLLERGRRIYIGNPIVKGRSDVETRKGIG